MPKRNFCDGLEDIERKDGWSNSTKCDARYVGHHKKLKNDFLPCEPQQCQDSDLSAGSGAPCPGMELFYYGHAVLQLLGGSSTIRTGAFSRRAKKAGAQQLALKINVRRNPAALWLAADCCCGRSNSNKLDADCCSLPALALSGIVAFLFQCPYFKLHVLDKIWII